MTLDLSGATYEYGHIILAIHGDLALRLLESLKRHWKRIFSSCFQTTLNTAALHSDTSSRVVRTAQNSPAAPISTSRNTDKVSLTYNINILQHMPTSKHSSIPVIFNPLTPSGSPKVQDEYAYRHPLSTPQTVAAQIKPAEIQNKRGTSSAGAWTNHGFYEDGFTSGLRAGMSLVESCPGMAVYPVQSALEEAHSKKDKPK
ncbi:unnamed protein product [Tuber aestivum]|uniref:Amine oxidase domain-containing protein n=1 Tax=Tuber aestivum TaxID=59557 RepID=A0A292Q7N1_9PEZI|nr:unnamed protein product [Tuber aestivum]